MPNNLADVTCVLCHTVPTWNEWWSGDCPKAEEGQTRHLLPLGKSPDLICPECNAACPNSQRVAAGMKCADCAYSSQVEDPNIVGEAS